MTRTPTKALVRTILVRAQDYPWRMQEIGLLGLRLSEDREYRLHVWAGSSAAEEPPVHDHPYDFTSSIVAGEMTNTRYVEDPSGAEYHRVRYVPSHEEERTSDNVRLSGVATTFTEGEHYAQLAHELHDSRQLPGTVTIIRCAFKEVTELTVCGRQEAAWVSGQSRPATDDEIRAITRRALEWF